MLNLPRRQAGLFQHLLILPQIMICNSLQKIRYQFKGDVIMNSYLTDF